MKRYNPCIRWDKLSGKTYPDMIEQNTNGEYVRYEDIRWHRNCAETPVPKDACKVIIVDFGDGNGERFVKYNPPCKAIPYCCEGYYELSGKLHRIHTVDVTRWREIPQIED